MGTVLEILAILGIIFGVLIFQQSKSAIHEIEAFLVFLISAVLLVGASIIGAIRKLGYRIAPKEKVARTAWLAMPTKKEVAVALVAVVSIVIFTILFIAFGFDAINSLSARFQKKEAAPESIQQGSDKEPNSAESPTDRTVSGDRTNENKDE